MIKLASKEEEKRHRKIAREIWRVLEGGGGRWEEEIVIEVDVTVDKPEVVEVLP